MGPKSDRKITLPESKAKELSLNNGEEKELRCKMGEREYEALGRSGGAAAQGRQLGALAMVEGRDCAREEAAGTCLCLQRGAGWCQSACPGLLGQGERTGREKIMPRVYKNQDNPQKLCQLSLQCGIFSLCLFSAILNSKGI